MSHGRKKFHVGDTVRFSKNFIPSRRRMYIHDKNPGLLIDDGGFIVDSHPQYSEHGVHIVTFYKHNIAHSESDLRTFTNGHFILNNYNSWSLITCKTLLTERL